MNLSITESDTHILKRPVSLRFAYRRAQDEDHLSTNKAATPRHRWQSPLPLRYTSLAATFSLTLSGAVPSILAGEANRRDLRVEGCQLSRR